MASGPESAPWGHLAWASPWSEALNPLQVFSAQTQDTPRQGQPRPPEVPSGGSQGTSLSYKGSLSQLLAEKNSARVPDQGCQLGPWPCTPSSAGLPRPPPSCCSQKLQNERASHFFLWSHPSR